MKRFIILLCSLFVICIAAPCLAYAEDRLAVMDSTGQNTVFVVTDTGQIGAGTGTPSPTAKVHVVDGRARLRIESSTNLQNAGILLGSKGSAGTLGIGGLFYMGDEGPMNRFFSMSADNLTYHVVVKYNGDVGIGSTAPTAKLDVNGNGIRIELPKTPASSADTCNQGDMSWDSNYVYVCTTTNSWKRAALTDRKSTRLNSSHAD